MEPTGDVVRHLRGADNDILRQHRATGRELVALLKSFDKDLQTLVSYNTNDENFTMSFNDSDLDEVQRMNAAKEAAQAFAEIRRIVLSQPSLTGSQGQNG